MQAEVKIKNENLMRQMLPSLQILNDFNAKGEYQYCQPNDVLSQTSQEEVEEQEEVEVGDDHKDIEN